MKTTDILGISFGNFKRRKMRSILTVMGVVIGTASIVVMMSLGIAINESFTESFKSMGDLTTIHVSTSWDENSGRETGKLDDALVEQLQGIENVSFVSPEISLSGKIISGRYQLYTSIRGIDMSRPDLLGFEAEQGSLFTEETKSTNKTIYALFGAQTPYDFQKKSGGGRSMSYSMYGGGVSVMVGGGDGGEAKPAPEVDVLNPDTRIRYTFDYSYGENNYQGSATSKKAPLYTVKPVGILKETQGNSDYSIYIDIETAKNIKLAQQKFNGNPTTAQKLTYDSISVYAKDIDSTQAIIDTITEMGYQAYGIGSMIKEVQNQMSMIQALLGAIGSVSLLVAAIGITNTMVMSIYERTREIGIMKVIGCYLNDIRTMFLVEAGFIGLFGGTVGIIISYALSYGMNQLANSGAMGAMSSGMMSTKISVIPPWLSLLAIFFATLVALISGFFPARRAMHLSALEAMKN